MGRIQNLWQESMIKFAKIRGVDLLTSVFPGAVLSGSFMAFKFENLDIWNKALDLSAGINELAKCFPKYELFNLCHQIRKASDSVGLNIAEGCTGQSNPEQRRFLNYSIRSGIEVVGCLFIAKRKDYLPIEQFHFFYTEYEILIRMITRFRDNLR